ncbi:MAG: hypothetical protein H7145_07345 [Akkermansiaceae bacterium]|nr:hypothetical protein [Armatimonadota bacterium]
MVSKKWLSISAGVIVAFTMGMNAFALPEDIVPRGDVAYDLLGSLSSAGQVKGVAVADFFRGDRLYTRREMAEFVADLLATNDVSNVPSSARSQIRALVTEFARELRARGVVIPNIPAGDAGFSLLVKARAGATPVSGDLIGRFSVTSAIGRDGYVAGSVGNYRDEWNAFRPARDFPSVETLFVRYNTPAIDITIGRQPLRWGPGFSGAMILGDDAPSIPQVRFEKGFFLPGSLGRRTGRLYFTQFAGQIFEDDIPGVDPVATGTRRFVFGRRIETAGDRGAWKLSVAETFKSTRLPGAGWALVLPFYAYQNAFTDEPNNDEQRPLGFIAGGNTYPNTLWFNYLIDAQISYRAIPDRDVTLYTDFLVDDIQAPKGLQGGVISTPRKIGLLLGGYCPRLDNAGKYGLRLEFSTIDPDTFSSVSAPVAYTVDGAPLGYSGGGNTRLFFGRFDARVSEKAKASAEIAVRRKDDDSRPGLSGNRFSLYGSYNLNRALFVGGRVDHVTGDIRLPNVSTTEETRGEVSIGYGF